MSAAALSRRPGRIPGRRRRRRPPEIALTDPPPDLFAGRRMIAARPFVWTGGDPSVTAMDMTSDIDPAAPPRYQVFRHFGADGRPCEPSAAVEVEIETYTLHGDELIGREFNGVRTRPASYYHT